MIRYRATTSAVDEDGHPCFNGKVYGIRFNKGIAMFDTLTVDKFIHDNPEEIAIHMVNDFGIKVTIVDEKTGEETLFDAQAAIKRLNTKKPKNEGEDNDDKPVKPAHRKKTTEGEQ